MDERIWALNSAMNYLDAERTRYWNQDRCATRTKMQDKNLVEIFKIFTQFSERWTWIEKKQLAAKEAVKYVKSGMTVGLGTGSTAAHMVRELGLLVKNGLEITGVPSSENTKKLAMELGIALTTLDKTNGIDIYIDGADEFDPYMQLIKGGGGALLREKILTYNSNLVIIIADSQKEVKRLGNFKLPVETIPFATKKIAQLLQEMGLLPKIRVRDDKNFVTDEGNFILDLTIGHISNIPLLESKLKQIPGIVETGLFLDMADIIIIGKGETTITIKK